MYSAQLCTIADDALNGPNDRAQLHKHDKEKHQPAAHMHARGISCRIHGTDRGDGPHSPRASHALALALFPEFASICVGLCEEATCRENTKIKKMVQNRTNQSEWYQKPEKMNRTFFDILDFLIFLVPVNICKIFF